MKAVARTLMLLAMSLFSFCKTTQYADAPRPPEQYDYNQEPPLISTIAIPVTISINDLTASLNKRVNGVVYEDLSYYDNDNDGLMFRATKTQPLSLYLSGQTIKYRVPLKIWMRKSLFIGSAEAEGELALNMKTTFSLNPDWTIGTVTELEYYEWINKPVLKTGIGDISIETISNLAINRSRKTMTATLDRLIAQQFSLRPYVQDAWTALQEPVLLSEEYKTWVKTTPLSIGITPLRTDWNNIYATIAVECQNDVTFGEKPYFRPNSTLPNLRYVSEDTPGDYQIRIATDIPFPEAERMARTIMVGQVFQSGRKKVRVDDIQLWGNNDKLVVNSRLSGSFNGNIYFIGKPVFNPVKNQVEVADLDFHVDTRNFLHKSAAWMFKGTIKKQMKDAMVFPLEENIRTLRTEVQSSLDNYELQPGVVLKGTIDSVVVQDTRLTPTSIRVNLFSKGKLNLDVKGL
ncbi:MAG: DUF4403 family protein [Saprospiraceae bacterium]|nr:DUF4403 family protein [Saprospiraceae bacterium]